MAKKERTPERLSEAIDAKSVDSGDTYKKAPTETTAQEIALRQELQQSLEAVSIKQELYADLPSSTAAFFLDSADKLKEDKKKLSKQLQLSTEDIIKQQRENRDISSALRYSQLTFLPLRNFPDSTIDMILGTAPVLASTYNPVTTIPFVYAPVVEIFAHTPSAPEYGIVDDLISVEDVTGDGFGFEETQGVYTTITSTFNYDYSGTGTNLYARLDRRIFDNNCFASSEGRKYELFYASGHIQQITVHPPSPCWQSSIGGANGTYTDLGWVQRYCSSEDYLSRRYARRNWTTGSQSKTDILSMSRNIQGGAGRFDWASSNYDPQLLIAPNKTFAAWDAATYPNSSYPNKADSGEVVANLLGQTISNTLSGGSDQYGSPIGGLSNAQITRTDMLIFPTKQQLNPDSYQSVIGTYSWVDNGIELVNSLDSGNASSVTDNLGNLMSPDKGTYGVVRNYTYAENLPDCAAPSPIDLRVCIDKSSPSFYQTTNEDCDGTDITAYLNGSSGAYNIIDGNCCAVDCSGFNMFISSTDSTYGANNGTITIDFTNQTGTAIGNYNSTANQHAYDVQLTASSGAAIIQNSNAAYASGATITDATCDTASGSSIVACNSNSSITVGMSVTGTGVTGTAFVGAITGGQPGAVTGFQLSSDASTNVPVNSSGAQTDTTLTFAIQPSRFVWGSLPPISGGFYTVTVTDDDNCVFTGTIRIREDDAVEGCSDSNAINYSSAATSSCSNCCVFCDDTDVTGGFFIDQSGNYMQDFITSFTITPTHETSINFSTGNGAGDGSISLTGTLNPNAAGFLTSTMSYKYTIQTYNGGGAGNLINGYNPAVDTSTLSGGFYSVHSPTTSTLAQGIQTTFNNLFHGHYAIKIEIEDSSTGSDAGLEKCFQWVVVDVKALVCDDSLAQNYNSTVPADLRIPDNGQCTYPVNCDCTILSLVAEPQGCSFKLKFTLACDPSSQTIVEWDLNGTPLVNPYSPISSTGFISTQAGELPGMYVTQSGTYTLTVTDNGAGGNCITTSSINVIVPICGCTDPNALNYDPLATIDDSSCIYCVDGCMDLTATNYNPLATCDDGSCTYPRLGCTDPLATNYDPNATIDDGSCLYPGCLDQTALNYLYDCNGAYNPNINVADPSCCNHCTSPIFNAVVTTNATASAVTCASNLDGRATIQNVSLSSGAVTWSWSVFSGGVVVYTSSSAGAIGATATTGSFLGAGAYTWEAIDSNGCSETGTFSIGSAPLNCGCTDPNATNYNPSATIDDGSCLYLGCTDPNAVNYNPAAIQDDGTCTYVIARNPCSLSPKSRRKLDSKMFGCLTLKGSMYLNKLRIGYADDCSIMNQWKLILVNYLLQQKDLDCMFNCSDDMTTAPAVITCSDLWITGGSTTGVNDQAHAGSSITTGEGTTITNPNTFFVVSNALYLGDVIKMPSGLIWKIVVSSATYAGYNPETSQGQQSGNWQQCTTLGTFPNTYTTNYIDPFIKFMNAECDKCTEDPDCVQGRLKGETPY